MSDEKYQSQDQEKPYGQIQIADEVIAIIAGASAKEVHGVAAFSEDPALALIPFFGKKNPSKGVKVNVEGSEAAIEVSIAVRYGQKLQDVAFSVQQKVKQAVHSMTGLTVVLVNVTIVALAMEMGELPKVENRA